MDWSQRLEKYAAFLPESERPVLAAYKTEKPGSDAQLNAYDVVYYAGDCNAGSKTIAINLPNDEEVQLQKGTRRLQLKNAMRAKFDKILVPIADILIAEDQRQHITFDAFFANTMFHEVAHILGASKIQLTERYGARSAQRARFRPGRGQGGHPRFVYDQTAATIKGTGRRPQGLLHDLRRGIFRSVASERPALTERRT